MTKRHGDTLAEIHRETPHAQLEFDRAEFASLADVRRVEELRGDARGARACGRVRPKGAGAALRDVSVELTALSTEATG